MLLPEAWVCGSCLQFLREKIKAEVEKRAYTPPPPSSVRSPAKPPRGGQPVSNGPVKDEWGEWGGASSQVLMLACCVSLSSMPRRGER